jgi:cystathionine beta-lyase
LYIAQEVNRAFPKLNWQPPEATYLAWIDLRPLNIDDRALQKVLIEQQKVAIMPGYTYGKGKRLRSPECGLPAQQAGTRGATPHCRD